MSFLGEETEKVWMVNCKFPCVLLIVRFFVYMIRCEPFCSHNTHYINFACLVGSWRCLSARGHCSKQCRSDFAQTCGNFTAAFWRLPNWTEWINKGKTKILQHNYGVSPRERLEWAIEDMYNCFSWVITAYLFYNYYHFEKHCSFRLMLRCFRHLIRTSCCLLSGSS